MEQDSMVQQLHTARENVTHTRLTKQWKQKMKKTTMTKRSVCECAHTRIKLHERSYTPHSQYASLLNRISNYTKAKNDKKIH